MPFFKTTYNILTKQDEDEMFDPNWFDSPTITLPPKTKWTYDREMQLEDVDIWEVIHESSNGIGVYAAWSPYAEFYLVCRGFDFKNPQRIINGFNYIGREWETYYGPEAQKQVYQRAISLGIPLQVIQTWVDPDDLWLYQSPKETKTIILPKDFKV